MTEDFFMRLCDVYGFAPSRALRELVDAAIGQAVVAERQACAKVVEEADLVEYEHCMVLHTDGHATLRNAAAAIRARGNT